jgi:hypothetical protein
MTTDDKEIKVNDEIDDIMIDLLLKNINISYEFKQKIKNLDRRRKLKKLKLNER